MLLAEIETPVKTRLRPTMTQPWQWAGSHVKVAVDNSDVTRFAEGNNHTCHSPDDLPRRRNRP